jgi:DNA-binding protein HU-beta
VNKAELVEALTGRLGDKKAATSALDAVLEEIQRTVSKGGKVSIAGFGVFEKRVRGARTARNPRTGEAVKVKKTSVPAFRAGQGFKDVVAGKKKIAAPPKKAATKATTAKTAKAATATKATAKKTAPAKKTTTAAAKKTTAKTTAAKKTATKTTAKKTTARKTATKSAAKRAPRTR